ncbi:MAG: hypothetical protein JNM18_00265 [Planctomycetaceae bacterium]|nr:hypothetical protein [Planctomycetaceae bacterium]
MQVRDRIREFRRVKASELRPHPKNWRMHPPEQQDALRGVLAETTPDAEVPVLIVDLSAEEAAKLLVVHDPLAAMAGTNEQLLHELLAEVETQNDAVRAMLDNLAHPSEAIPTDAEPPAIDLKPLFQVVVECADEAEQQSVYERLRGEGLVCRVLTL